MIYGVNTQRAFMGRCVPLRRALDEIIIRHYDDDPPVNLAHLFQLKLLRELCRPEMRMDYPGYVGELYESIDDPILKHALNEDHLWILTVNVNGFYLANCLPKGY